MKLKLFKTLPNPPKMVPGRMQRDWMENAPDKWPYRCLPLSIANTSGWEVLCPETFDVFYNGGNAASDIIISVPGKPDYKPGFVTSHFGLGVLTFHIGYLVRTEKGWATWFMGVPNQIKHGIVPLSGLVETDWLPFTATMNWKFSNAGVVRFEEGEPFCFLTLVPHLALDEVEPELFDTMDAEEGLKERYDNWSKSRNEFNYKLSGKSPDGIPEVTWQKDYFQGRILGESTKIDTHIHKRRLSAVGEDAKLKKKPKK